MTPPRLAFRLPLIALALAALVAAVLTAPRPAEAQANTLWTATITPESWRGGSADVFGCSNARASVGDACSDTSILTDDDFVIGGKTRSITALIYLDFDDGRRIFRFDFPASEGDAPTEQLNPYELILSDPSGSRSRTLPLSVCYDFGSNAIECVATSLDSSVSLKTGVPTKLTLQLPEVQTQAATRTNTSTRHCGSPDLAGVEASTTLTTQQKTNLKNALAESAEKGLWHCHGDSYHRHPDWRARHPKPGATVRATGDRAVTPEAKAATADERAAGWSGWHSHNQSGYNVYHRHASGDHPH